MVPGQRANLDEAQPLRTIGWPKPIGMKHAEMRKKIRAGPGAVEKTHMGTLTSSGPRA
jgi:hypothetical protein